MNEALTVPEADQLDELETVIDRGIKTFAEVGAALLSIRDARLYRAEYGTFDQYCKSRWGINASRARQLIGAASVIENIQSVTIVTPQTESQSRPLASLPPKDQPKAWEAANEKAEAEGRKVTAKDVEAEVRTIKTQTMEVNKTKTMMPIGPPCVGMQFARIAILNLDQIKNNDIEREQAINAVKEWMVKNEA